MDLSENYVDFLRAACDHSVEFVIVGAMALAIHGMPRYTGDLDLLVRPSADNADRLIRALISADFPVPFEAADLVKPDQVCFIGWPPCRIDFLTGICGVSFDEVWQGRVESVVSGLVLPVIGLETLLRNKVASGRLKDLADAEVIRARLKESS
jgi:hypothetical protein